MSFSSNMTLPIRVSSDVADELSITRSGECMVVYMTTEMYVLPALLFILLQYAGSGTDLTHLRNLIFQFFYYFIFARGQQN